jgi:hypothetical protein
LAETGDVEDSGSQDHIRGLGHLPGRHDGQLYIIRATMKQVEALLPSSQFVRIHRLHIVLEAESLRADRSAAYAVRTSTTDTNVQFIGYFDRGSYACYDDVDLSGVRSIEVHYAKGESDPRRFAILIADERDVRCLAASHVGGWPCVHARESRRSTGRAICKYGLEDKTACSA